MSPNQKVRFTIHGSGLSNTPKYKIALGEALPEAVHNFS
jgi:hypothetical protein